MNQRLNSKVGKGRRKFFTNITIGTVGFLTLSSIPFGQLIRKRNNSKLLKPRIHPSSIKRNN